MLGRMRPRRSLWLGSDLLGGFSDKTFKMPNPNYYLP